MTTTAATSLLPEGKHLFRVSEVAALADTPLRTMYGWTSRGIVRTVRIGGQVLRVPRPEVVRILGLTSST